MNATLGRLRAPLVATAALLVLTAGTVGASAPVTVAPPTPTGPVSSVVTLAPATVLAQARAGRLDVTLAGRAYALRLAPAPWRLDAAETVVSADGTETTLPSRGPSEAFVGTVAGRPDTRVLVTVTPAGVDGYVEADGRSVQFQPLRFVQPDASADLAVVDTIAAPAPAPASDAPAGTASIVNPVLLEWGDYTFYARYGSANWASKMTAVLSRTNSNYNSAFGWFFTRLASLYACNSSSCDTSWGSTSTNSDTLLYNWALRMEDRHDAGTDSFDLAHLYSGKNFDGSVNGTSQLPGRYTATQYADESPYHGQTSDHEGSQVQSHEFGHNFRALHDNTSYREPVTVCDLMVPVVNICLQSHQENTGPQHWTIMCGACEHQPPDQLWDRNFTTTNRNQIRTCHDGTWSSGTYTPSTSFSMNMGSSC